VWNAMSQELWGLRADEVEGKDFMELDIGLPVHELDDAISRSLGGSKGTLEARVPAINRRGQRFECLVRVMPLQTRAGHIYGSMVLVAPTSDSLPAPELAT
jgi:two-component system CheB/CheR fusion protein